MHEEFDPFTTWASLFHNDGLINFGIRGGLGFVFTNTQFYSNNYNFETIIGNNALG